MSLSPDSDATALLATNVSGVHYLVDLYFQTGAVRYTTHAIDIQATTMDKDGNEALRTYTGFGSLVDVSTIGESENTADDKISLGLSIVNSALLAACIGNVANYRGQRATLWLQFIGPTFQPVGSPIEFWNGYMEPVQIDRKTSPDSASTGRISIPCRRAGMARARHAEGLRLSDSQQQATYTGDKFYEFLATLMERPTPLLTLAFQKSLAG